jgi:hypothetical protein
MNDGERFRTGPRKQPENQWSNNAGSISRGEIAGGSIGDKRKPGDEWEVAAERAFHARILDRIYKMFSGFTGHLVNPEKSCKSCPTN